MGMGTPGTAVLGTVNAATNNIPTAYADSAGSLVLTGLSRKTHIAVTNTASTSIAIAIYAGQGTHTAATDNLVCTNGGTLALDDLAIGTTVYIRSLGTSISTGSVYITVW